MNLPSNKDVSSLGLTPITWRKVVVIFALLIFSYSAAINSQYIWDDDSYVTENLALRTPQGLFAIWFKPGTIPQYYPLVFTAFWTQYHLWGLNPLGYHLVNVLLHGASAILFWLVLLRLRIPGAFLAAGIFALHPVHVESVAWITELKNVLSGVFYLLALGAYLRFIDSQNEGRGKRDWRFYVFAIVFFTGALLSKTVTATLPVAILLIQWWRTAKIPWDELRRLWVFFALAIVFGGATVLIERHQVGAMGADWAFSGVERVLIAGSAIWFYFTKLLWPQPLIFTYPRWEIDAGVWWQYLFPGTIACFLFWLWQMRTRFSRGPLAAVLFFIGTLFPALGFFNVYPMRFSFVADHFQYHASLGLIALFAALVYSGLSRLPQAVFRRAETAIVGVVFLGLAILTWRQSGVYQNSITLFSDVIQKNPSSWMAYNNRGVQYINRGWLDLAMQDFKSGRSFKPNYAEAYNNQALVHQLRNENEQALVAYGLAIQVDPRFPMAYANRALLLSKMGKTEEALRDINRALLIFPAYAEGYLRRGMIYSGAKKYQQAMRDFNRALKMNPFVADAYMGRGQVYLDLGEINAAMQEYNRALTIFPTFSAVFYRRAALWEKKGDFQKAYDDLGRARQLGYPVPVEDAKRIILGLVEEQDADH